MVEVSQFPHGVEKGVNKGQQEGKKCIHVVSLRAVYFVKCAVVDTAYVSLSKTLNPEFIPVGVYGE